ncbi:MAG: hypothetical protein EB100_02370, partial [Crocinitomicaceae bacterium]|nr:hypothetical protein [Crocinitomicaceae bacterium]
SKKRAQAIQDFFVKNGLDADKLVIDFKGEKELINPKDQSDNGSNSTVGLILFLFKISLVKF